MVIRDTRRVSSSGRAQQLWDAIKAVRLQKQIPAITRMGRYMNRFYQLKKDETQRLLDLAVEDNLIKLENKIGTKGTKSGVEEKAYRLPTSDMLPRERHDWYCFHCHTAGEVILCSTCHRVYHESCLKEPLVNPDDDFICKYCQVFQKVPEAFNKRERRDLNHLFRLVCHKLKRRMPDNLLTREIPQPPSKSVMDSSLINKDHQQQQQQQQQLQLQQQQQQQQQTLPQQQVVAPQVQQQPLQVQQQPQQQPQQPPLQQQQQQQPQQQNIVKKIEEETWRASFLLKQQIDFAEIERKCSASEYRNTEEFRAGCQLIVHNVVIYHGVHSNMADLARQMFRDCVCDLRDIDLCRDCFRYSAESDDKYWFCKPCRPFHELVYARQKGFPYWPAKVIRTVENNMYDVRFFGGYHQRALVEKNHIKPITVNIHTLQVKRTSSWNKACEELRKHQEYLAKVKADSDFLKDPYGNPFASPDLKVEFPESDHNEDEEDSDGRYPGEEDQRQREEDAELLRRPNNIIGDAPVVVTTPSPQQRSAAAAAAAKAAAAAAAAAAVAAAGLVPGPTAPPGVSGLVPVVPAATNVLVAGATAIPPVATAAAATLDNKDNLNLTKDNLQNLVAADEKKKRGRPKKSKKEEAEDYVSSSSQQEARFINAGVQTPSKLLKAFPTGGAVPEPSPAAPPILSSSISAAANASTRKPTEREFKEFAEKLRADFDQEKKRAVNVATRSLERDLERLKADHATEMEELLEKHKQEISENKKKQWCYHCEAEAIYWCCWNTAYCSIECQQEHWHKEHKRACRRKR